MSDTNAATIGLILETTAGTTPTSPAFETIRTTGQAGLSASPITVRSTELRTDRRVTDLILVGREAGGDISMEVAYGTFDTLMEGAMFNTWTEKPTVVNVTADIEISDVLAATDTITVITAQGSQFVDQMLIEMTGFTDTTLNVGLHEVVSSTATTVVVESSPGLVDEPSVPLGARIRYVGFVGASGDITATAGPDTLTSTTLDFTTLGLVAGDWIKVGGNVAGEQFIAGNVNGNGLCRVGTTAITATVLTLDVVPALWAADTAASQTIQVWVGDFIREGTTDRSYSIEQQFSDHSPVTFQLYTGMEVNSFTIQADSQAVVTASATFVGRDAAFSETRTSGATDVAANTNDVLNTSSDVGILFEDGVALAAPNHVLSTSITINNAMRRQNAVANIGSVGFGKGKADVQIGLQTYFGNQDLAEKVLNNTTTSYTFSLEDNNNNMYVFDAPSVKFSEGSPDVGGEDDDILLPLTGQAIRHATLLYQFHVQRFTHFDQ